MEKEAIKWIDERTAIINGGSKVKFVGTIKGLEDFGTITYFADSVEELTDGLVLSEWDYRIKSTQHQKLNYLRDI